MSVTKMQLLCHLKSTDGVQVLYGTVKGELGAPLSPRGSNAIVLLRSD